MVWAGTWWFQHLTYAEKTKKMNEKKQYHSVDEAKETHNFHSANVEFETIISI